MTLQDVSPQRRLDILDALRRGAVPAEGLDVLAVGLDRFQDVLSDDLDRVRQGKGVFKAVRGEYGTGKTFFSRWFQERARKQGFVTTEVQVSEADTRLHKMQTVYRAAMQRLRTDNFRPTALPDVIDRWIYRVQSEASSRTESGEPSRKQVERKLEEKLKGITRATPQFAAALREYHRAISEGDVGQAQGLLGWLAGNPNVGASIKREADITGDIDHQTALSFVGSLLTVLEQADFSGLILVLDEVETLQRVRSDVREKSLNALRQMIDYLDEGRFPGLYVLITGTPAFFEGSQGIQRLPPLAQRLHTDFSTPVHFDNPRAPQIRLLGLGRDQLIELGRKVRDLYAIESESPERIWERVGDEFVKTLADAVVGEFDNVKIAPRLFLKKLVADVLDRVDEFEGFRPMEHYELTTSAEEMTTEERNQAFGDLDDVSLEFDK
jgi:hypothetical protein